MAIFLVLSYNGRLRSEHEKTCFLYDTNILHVNWVKAYLPYSAV